LYGLHDNRASFVYHVQEIHQGDKVNKQFLRQKGSVNVMFQVQTLHGELDCSTMLDPNDIRDVAT
jgi:hypothetical protein